MSSLIDWESSFSSPRMIITLSKSNSYFDTKCNTMALSWCACIISLHKLILIFCSDHIMPLSQKTFSGSSFSTEAQRVCHFSFFPRKTLTDLSKLLLHFIHPRPWLFSTHNSSFLPLLIPSCLGILSPLFNILTYENHTLPSRLSSNSFFFMMSHLTSPPLKSLWYLTYLFLIAEVTGYF